MNRLKLLIISISLSICTSINAAIDLTQTTSCNQLAGHWSGVFTFKKPEPCNRYNGCTHIALVDFFFASDNFFQIKIKTGVGDTLQYNIACLNGIISSPLNANNESTISCDYLNHCIIVYEDADVYAEITNR